MGAPRSFFKHMNVFFSTIFSVLAAIALAGCAPIPDKNFTNIGNGLAGARTGIIDAQGNITDTIPHTDPVGKALLGSASHALDNSTKNIDIADASLTKAVGDYDTVSKDDTMVRNSIGWRVEQFIKGAIILSIIIAVIVFVAFPIATPFLMNIPGFFGGFIQHLSAMLPGQNLKLITNTLIGQKMVAIPKTQPVIPTVTAGGVTVTAASPVPA
jgi:hypothetical protein